MSGRNLSEIKFCGGKFCCNMLTATNTTSTHWRVLAASGEVLIAIWKFSFVQQECTTFNYLTNSELICKKLTRVWRRFYFCEQVFSDFPLLIETLSKSLTAQTFKEIAREKFLMLKSFQCEKTFLENVKGNFFFISQTIDGSNVFP